ncbi:hypothetical protein GQ457_16G018270 [Hibiscus cannabinus]
MLMGSHSTFGFSSLLRQRSRQLTESEGVHFRILTVRSRRLEDQLVPETTTTAEQTHTTPSSPVIPVSSHTTTSSPATTPAAPAEQIGGRTPSGPSSPPSAPAQSEEAGSLQLMLLRSQLQRIEARQLQFQNDVKVFQDTLTKFLIYQFPASAAFFGQPSAPPTQPSTSAAAAAPPSTSAGAAHQSTNTSAKEGATEELHFSSDDENDVFDWQSPRDHLLALGPSTSTPAPAVPILSAAPTPTTATAFDRLTPISPSRRRGKATAKRQLGGDSSSEEEAAPRPAKKRKYHIITTDSCEEAVLGMHHMRQNNQKHFKECMIQGLCENSVYQPARKRFSRRLKDHVFRDTHTQKAMWCTSLRNLLYNLKLRSLNARNDQPGRMKGSSVEELY